jgi:hypothetical protein
MLSLLSRANSRVEPDHREEGAGLQGRPCHSPRAFAPAGYKTGTSARARSGTPVHQIRVNPVDLQRERARACPRVDACPSLVFPRNEGVRGSNPRVGLRSSLISAPSRPPPRLPLVTPWSRIPRGASPMIPRSLPLRRSGERRRLIGIDDPLDPCDCESCEAERGTLARQGNGHGSAFHITG